MIRRRGSAASGPAAHAASAEPVGRVLLDTTVVIDALRGRPAADRIRSLRRTGDDPCVCVITVEEVWRGSRPGEEQGISRLLRGLRLAPLDRAAGERAGRWRRTHAERGISLSQADCLIAAAAVGVGARLATGNPDDFPMPDLDVDHWPVDQ